MGMSGVDVAEKAPAGAVVGSVIDSTHHRIAPKKLATAGSWPPGYSPNPRGRPAVGASYKEWLGSLDTESDGEGTAKYSQEQLEAIRDNPALTRAKRCAAIDLLGMLNGEYSRSGIPHMANHRDAILDRTVGKPTQTVAVAHITIEPMGMSEEMRTLLASDPRLLAEVRGSVDAAALPMIEGEATPIEGVGAPSGDA